MIPSKVTAEERERALVIHREHGPGEAARQTGIPRTTISSWAARARTQTDAADASADADMRLARLEKATAAATLTRQERAARLADDLLRIAEERVGIVLAHQDEITSARDVQTLMTTVGIAIDKSQLLAGQATARPEAIGNRDEAERRIAEIQAEWRRRAEQRRAKTGS